MNTQEQRKRNPARYFVMGRTLWNTDHWKPVAGPFPTRYAAQEAANLLADNGINDSGQQNLKNVYQTCVNSVTQIIGAVGGSRREDEIMLVYGQVDYYDQHRKDYLKDQDLARRLADSWNWESKG